MASEYIIYSPSQTPYFVQTLLGIDVSKLNLQMLTQLGYTKNKPVLIRELTWLVQNREAINQGRFNDTRYSFNNNDDRIKLENQKEESFWGSTASWVLGGVAVAGAGVAAAGVVPVAGVVAAAAGGLWRMT